MLHYGLERRKKISEWYIPVRWIFRFEWLVLLFVDITYFMILRTYLKIGICRGISCGKLNAKLWTTRWVWLYCSQHSYFQCYSKHTLLMWWWLLSSRKIYVISISFKIHLFVYLCSMNSSWGTAKWNKMYEKVWRTRDYKMQFLKRLSFGMWCALQTCTEKVNYFESKICSSIM